MPDKNTQAAIDRLCVYFGFCTEADLKWEGFAFETTTLMVMIDFEIEDLEKAERNLDEDIERKTSEVSINQISGVKYRQIDKLFSLRRDIKRLKSLSDYYENFYFKSKETTLDPLCFIDEDKFMAQNQTAVDRLLIYFGFCTEEDIKSDDLCLDIIELLERIILKLEELEDAAEIMDNYTDKFFSLRRDIKRLESLLAHYTDFYLKSGETPLDSLCFIEEEKIMARVKRLKKEFKSAYYEARERDFEDSRTREIYLNLKKRLSTLQEYGVEDLRELGVESEGYEDYSMDDDLCAECSGGDW